MKKLVEGIVKFRETLTDEMRNLFKKIASEQKPDALLIACSDSRVVPNLFASTDPGDLFVLRNIGNLVPPATGPQDTSAAAALEFSLFSVNVRDIIVCGHSGCGAMQALAEGSSGAAFLNDWLKHAQPSVERVKAGVSLDHSLPFHDQISQINVLQQIEHIKTYPFIQERLEKKQLRIHGWWFDVASASVFAYDPDEHKFVLIDKKQAQTLLDRLS